MAELQTERLRLREFRDSDVDPLYEIQGDREHMRYTFCAESREACERWHRRYADSLPKNGFAPWTIELRTVRRVIGWGGLSIDPLDPGWGPEVSYFIHQAHQGQGFATELVRCSLQHGFNDLGLAKIGAFAMPENEASNRVLIKCGFKFLRYEQTLRRNHYEILAPDWNASPDD